MLDPPEPELQVVVSHTYWEPNSSPLQEQQALLKPLSHLVSPMNNFKTGVATDQHFLCTRPCLHDGGSSLGHFLVKSLSRARFDPAVVPSLCFGQRQTPGLGARG